MSTKRSVKNMAKNDDYTPKKRTLQIRVEKLDDEFIISLLREYRKACPSMTKSDVVRNIIRGFKALTVTPLAELLNQLPQENGESKDEEK